MRNSITHQRQAGFALINAIFLLVVLAFLGVVMVTLSGVQSRTPLFALQGARAYHAARSGLEWGASRAVAENCAASTTFPVEGFSVTVTCTRTDFTEATITTKVYLIEALAELGSYGSTDYISRQVEMKIGL